MLRNLSASISSTKPNTTFTVFSQPPERGRLFSQEGKMANKVNGSAKASENPNMPTTGIMVSPRAAKPSTVATMGPVHENDTSTNVKAMKNTPNQPPLSA